MHRRHPVPRQWLMTDERMGNDLWAALERMPRGSGVVFRHYATADRRELLARVTGVARRRGLVVLAAGGLAGPDGVHNARGRGIISLAVHNRRDAIAARRAGADLVFVSPVFATRSHPGARALGVARLGLLVRGLPMPVIALGGMSGSNVRRLASLGIYGWAGIDAWTGKKASSRFLD